MTATLTMRHAPVAAGALVVGVTVVIFAGPSTAAASPPLKTARHVPIPKGTGDIFISDGMRGGGSVLEPAGWRAVKAEGPSAASDDWDIDAFLADASTVVDGWHVDADAEKEWSDSVTATAQEAQSRTAALREE